ncbi:hypothetical protein [Novosphingobium sp. KACC 22771]|uniref:hypothetical protein n=1 Tax=Novosphingobium sp. KACC 22771 TaxID=3025670 RepID=UPI0023672A44|nr:hypothetical protein [Novosphingobium sp. KACC 22771]WDF71506.1 hypothetical protein PQ467_11885 [Novosphingobium sp. KACC 22771]
MKVQIDDLLAQLGAAAPDPRLAMIEAAVLEGAERARQPVLSVPMLAGIAAVAMVSGALVSGMGAAPRAPVDPLGQGLALAPSTLLGRAL